MAMTVTFELSDSDLEHFRDLMKRTQTRSSDIGEQKIIADARALIQQIRASGATGFILSRVDKLETLIAMILDQNWRMEAAVREHIVQVVTYFAEGDDLIPDHVPGLGFLDDAIMIELLVREMEEEIRAYRNFLVERVAALQSG